MGRCEPCGKGEAMAGGKEESAVGLGLRDSVEVKDFKIWDTPMRVGLHCSIASFSVHIPRLSLLADLLLFLFLAAKILHNSLRLVRGQTALTASRGTLQHIPGLKQMQNSEFRAGAEQRGSETTRGSGPGCSAPPPPTAASSVALVGRQ